METCGHCGGVIIENLTGPVCANCGREPDFPARPPTAAERREARRPEASPPTYEVTVKAYEAFIRNGAMSDSLD